MQPQTFIFFGPSGSGKGKQVELLMEVLKTKDPAKNIIYVETGEKFREFIQENSFSANEVKKLLDNGELAPEFMPIYLWTRSLIENFSGEECLIFDGTPRKIKEAEILDSALKFYKRENPIIISLEVSDKIVIERMLKRGRTDDNENDIKNRLDFYHKDVVPAINYFKNNPYYKFIAVNGERSIEEVHQDLVEKVGL